MSKCYVVFDKDIRGFASSTILGKVKSLKEAKRMVAPLKEWTISQFVDHGCKATLRSSELTRKQWCSADRIDKVKYPEWYNSAILLQRFRKQGTK